MTLAASAACPELDPPAPGDGGPDLQADRDAAVADAPTTLGSDTAVEAATEAPVPDSTASAGDGGAAGALVTYTLDLTAVRQPRPEAPMGEVRGTAIFRSNAFAAFSTDLAVTTKKIAQLDWDTVNEWPSRASCDGFPAGGGYLPDAERGPNAVGPLRPDDLLKGFRSPYRVHLRKLELDMPHRVPQDSLPRVAGGLCVVVRTGDGTWRWRAHRFVATQDTAAGRASASIDLDVRDVDAVAILFDSGTAVATVRYTIERSGAPPAGDRGDIATAGCCTACAPDGPDLTSRYCCTSGRPGPEPCTDEEIAPGPQCRLFADLHQEARAACRARGTWLRSIEYLDPDLRCGRVELGRPSPTGARGIRFRCCRDDFFVPPPPSGAPASDCQLVGGLSSPCASNATMLERQVEACYRAGLVHRTTIFANDCAGGGAGSANVQSICCRPGVVGPPVDYCRR